MNKVKDILTIKEYNALKDELIKDEYYLTMDQDWTVEQSFKSEIFLSLTEDAKKAYALTHSEQWAIEKLNLNTDDFIKEFGNYYEDFYSL